MKRIDNVEHQLEAGAFGAAYRELLSLWQKERWLELAEVIDLAQKKLCRSALDLPAANKKIWADQWLARARHHDALELPLLLDALVRQAERKKAALVASCLDVVMQSEGLQNPALTAPLMALLRAPGGSSTWTKVQTRLFKLVEAVADPRAIGQLAALVEQVMQSPQDRPPSVYTSVTTRAPKLIAKLEARFSSGDFAAPADVVARLEALTARLNAPLPERQNERVTLTDDQKLLAAIYETPDDDAPRAVYADLLTQRGDPRGEFIVAQLQGKNEKAERLAARLLKKHRRAWLGALAPYVVGEVYFERGFLARCTFDFRRKTTAQNILRQKELGTLREVALGDNGVLSNAFLSLERAFQVPENGLGGLERIELPRLRELEVVPARGVDPLGDRLGAGLAALAKTRGLPRLETLWLRLRSRGWSMAEGFRVRDARDYKWLHGAPIAGQIQRLGVCVESEPQRVSMKTIVESWAATLRDEDCFPKLESLLLEDVNAIYGEGGAWNICYVLQRTQNGLQGKIAAPVGKISSRFRGQNEGRFRKRLPDDVGWAGWLELDR